MILDSIIPYLVTMFDAAVASPVFDGPKPVAVNHGEFVLVGSTGEEDDGARFEMAASDLGPGSWFDEFGEVVCSAWSWSGGTDIVARRAKALALASACVTAVHADRRLGGLCLEPGAVVSDLSYQPRQSDTGAIVRVVFSVTYKALNT